MHKIIINLGLAASPSPNEHLGLFCRNQKTQVFAPFAANGNTACVKIAPIARQPMHPMMVSAIDAIRWDLGQLGALLKGSRATP